MEAKKLIQLILNSEPLFSKYWLNTNDLFFDKQYVQTFASNLISYSTNSISDSLPLPNFSEEVTPNRSESYSFFSTAISKLKKEDFENNISNQTILADSIQSTPFQHILLIMGQRQTPATLKTVEGLPLKKQTLIDSCLNPFNNQISVGVRAWEKHIDRTEDSFWGKIKGTPQQKLDKAMSIITYIIDNHTWWNTFHHYKHNVVFEIRVKSGHGMRWSKQDQSLIGFLEPFL